MVSDRGMILVRQFLFRWRCFEGGDLSELMPGYRERPYFVVKLHDC
jgi:hypothetical protein